MIILKYHIKRSDKEIKDKETMTKILKQTQYVTLAMVKDGEPYLVSLSHGYDEENNCIYIHSASEGKKLDYINANPNIWGQALIDKGYHENECSHLFASVMFKGKVTWLETPEEKDRAFKTMILQLEPNPERLLNKFIGSKNVHGTVTGRIDIEYMTGKISEEVNL